MAKSRIAFYAQSGGPTAVINNTARGVIDAANAQGIKVYAGKNGIIGLLKEEMYDTRKESKSAIASLEFSPASAFGTCRYKLKGLEQNQREYERMIEVFEAHNIEYFFYNGGGDSQDTAHKVSQLAEKMGYPITCIGVPKTIDNDLPFTDNCPGFGSVAKYVAVSIREAGLDVESMAATSTKVFILEVMGRHTGWIAAAAGLATETEGQSPHLILFPEIPFDSAKFLKSVEKCVKKFGFCTIVVSEGVKDTHGKFLSDSGLKDAFGHAQLGGIAPTIAALINEKLGYKFHWAVADYLQRAARHIASKVDVDQAYALGQAAVKLAISGKNAVMPIIQRNPGKKYGWTIGEVPLSQVANVEKLMPRNFIRKEGFHITEKCREYLSPLIQGESYPPYKNGLPVYLPLKNILVPQKLKGNFKV